jgi:hypothetical protein
MERGHPVRQRAKPAKILQITVMLFRGGLPPA